MSAQMEIPKIPRSPAFAQPLAETLSEKEEQFQRKSVEEYIIRMQQTNLFL